MYYQHEMLNSLARFQLWTAMLQLCRPMFLRPHLRPTVEVHLTMKEGYRTELSLCTRRQNKQSCNLAFALLIFLMCSHYICLMSEGQRRRQIRVPRCHGGVIPLPGFPSKSVINGKCRLSSSGIGLRRLWAARV